MSSTISIRHAQKRNVNLNTAWRPDNRHAAVVAGMLWVLLVLMIVPDGFDYAGLATTGAPASGGGLSRMLWLALMTFGAIVILWRARLTWALMSTLNPFLALIVALAVASVAWSIDPSLSVRRLVRMATIVLTCIAFVSIGWHARRFQNVLRPIITLVLVGSIAFGLAFPALAIHGQLAPELSGAWHGLANHKNGLGALSSIALVLWFHAGLAREIKVLPALAGCAVAAVCLVLSRSSTSLMAALFAMTFLLLFLRAPQGLRPYRPYFIAAIVLALLVYGLAILNLIPGMGALLAPVAVLTGKDVTLTGRTEIWTILAEHIGRRPILGSGYAAYWTAGPVAGTEAYEFVTRMRGFYPGSAHNGYLEITNELGLTGLVLLLGYIVTHIRQSLRLLRVDSNQGTLLLALFFQQAITNQSESHWFSVLSVDFVVMTLISTALARSLLEQRLRAFFGEPQAAIGGRSETSTDPMNDLSRQLGGAS